MAYNPIKINDYRGSINNPKVYYSENSKNTNEITNKKFIFNAFQTDIERIVNYKSIKIFRII